MIAQAVKKTNLYSPKNYKPYRITSMNTKKLPKHSYRAEKPPPQLPLKPNNTSKL